MMCLIKRNLDYDIYSPEHVTNNYMNNHYINDIEEQDIFHVLKVTFFLTLYGIFMFKIILNIF